MREFFDYLASVPAMKLASNPVVLVAAAIVFLIAVLMRWKYVVLLLFGIGGMLAVARYARIDRPHGPLDPGMVVFIAGSIVVGVVLIYFLFIRGD